MEHSFSKEYWDEVWTDDRGGSMSVSPPNPHLLTRVGDLRPGTALDAGCGAGAEATWLATQGWMVLGVDVSATALALARERAKAAERAENVTWVQADLATWEPPGLYDLVTTHYAHPPMPQLRFYERIATWVAPGGTLLIVGHLHHSPGADRVGPEGRTDEHGSDPQQNHHHGRHETRPPAAASATAATITAVLSPTTWDVVTAEESQRMVTGPGGGQSTVHDVVVRATRRR